MLLFRSCRAVGAAAQSIGCSIGGGEIVSGAIKALSNVREYPKSRQYHVFAIHSRREGSAVQYCDGNAIIRTAGSGCLSSTGAENPNKMCQY